MEGSESRTPSRIGERDLIITAAAIRWYLQGLETPDAVPHEIVEYQASADVLEALESHVPGLKGFLDGVTLAARLAAALKLARQIQAPTMVISDLQSADTRARSAVINHVETMRLENLQQLLDSYARIADLAGVLTT